MEEFTPHSHEKSVEAEPTISELMQKALEDGWIEKGDEEYFGKDLPDVLQALYSYILQADGDPDEVFAAWGVAFEIAGESE